MYLINMSIRLNRIGALVVSDRVFPLRSLRCAEIGRRAFICTPVSISMSQSRVIMRSSSLTVNLFPLTGTVTLRII